MMTLIETRNFRCLRYISQPLAAFHVLVGANASGKTTFLDVIAFLGRLVSNGIEAAMTERTKNFSDLLWDKQEAKFELAMEAHIPELPQSILKESKQEFSTIRYEVSIGIDAKTDAVAILTEKVLLKPASTKLEISQRYLFPMPPKSPASIIAKRTVKGIRTVINKVYESGKDHFYSELYEKSGGGWVISLRLGPHKSALGNLPDESKFPAATWLRKLLTEGQQQFVLNSLLIRQASPPGQIRGFKPDGSNLPWVIENFRKQAPKNFHHWIRHLQTALADLKDIDTIEREDDKHRYLRIHYQNGLKVPSWMASDGTLRLLALTLPAYLPNFSGIYLIEEPENGIHPRAIETLYQSLSSVYNAQILLATHSPIILSMAEAEKVLCFAKTLEGATDIVLGNQHPSLKDWQGQPNLGELFASGVLG